MRFHYDNTMDAFSITFHEGVYAESDEVKDGVILDYDEDGKIMGIEILDASKNFAPPFAESIVNRRISVDVTPDPTVKV